MLVVVTSVVTTGRLGGSQLLSGGGLGLGVQVLDLGLTEDAAEWLVKELSADQRETYIQVLLEGER
jgi:hypothetical protein